MTTSIVQHMDDHVWTEFQKKKTLSFGSIILIKKKNTQSLVMLFHIVDLAVVEKYLSAVKANVIYLVMETTSHI